MRILFSTYSLAFQNPGGGERVLLSLQRELKRQGHEVDLFNPWRHHPRDYEIIHYFSCLETSFWNYAKEHAPGAPLLVTPTFWRAPGWKPRWETLKMKLLGATQSAAGHADISQWQRFKNVDYWLPATESEAQSLVKYRPVKPASIRVLPNGVDGRFAEAKGDAFRDFLGIQEPFVLHVGRFDPVKNQLGLIRELSSTSLHAVFIGGMDPLYPDFHRQCVEAAAQSGRIRILPAFSHDNPLLASAYAACAVFALPSWSEIFPLSALEAAVAGAPLVLTRNMASRTHYEGFADWVDPADMKQVVSAIEAHVRRKERLPELVTKQVLDTYGWPTIARELAGIYQAALAGTRLSP